MKVHLSAKESSGQLTIKMLDIEFESDTLMNASQFVAHLNTAVDIDSQDLYAKKTDDDKIWFLCGGDVCVCTEPWYKQL